jgi:hypothetical protein
LLFTVCTFVGIGCGGVLTVWVRLLWPQILEYQSFRKYRERRHVTEVTAANYAAITFYPDKFESFLLREVGFRRCTVLDPITADLKRPLFVFCK